MSNKEVNLSILDKLYEQIYRRIDNWDIPEGNYTCGMIEEYVREEIGKRRGILSRYPRRYEGMHMAYKILCGEIDWWCDSDEKIKSKEVHIQVDTFKCSFFEYELIPITMKFESMCNIRASNRQRFYKEDIISPKAV